MLSFAWSLETANDVLMLTQPFVWDAIAHACVRCQLYKTGGQCLHHVKLENMACRAEAAGIRAANKAGFQRKMGNNLQCQALFAKEETRSMRVESSDACRGRVHRQRLSSQQQQQGRSKQGRSGTGTCEVQQ